MSLEAALASEDSRWAVTAAALPTPTTSCEVRHVKGATFEFLNAGNGSAYEVDVSGENTERFDGPSGVAEWPAGSSHRVFAVGSLQTGMPQLRVTWRNTTVDPPVHEWTRPLPTA